MRSAAHRMIIVSLPVRSSTLISGLLPSPSATADPHGTAMPPGANGIPTAPLTGPICVGTSARVKLMPGTRPMARSYSPSSPKVCRTRVSRHDVFPEYTNIPRSSTTPVASGWPRRSIIR